MTTTETATRSLQEITIEGDDLETLRILLDTGGDTHTPAYRFTVRHYPTTGTFAVEVNDTGFSIPMGRVTRTIPV